MKAVSSTFLLCLSAVAAAAVACSDAGVPASPATPTGEIPQDPVVEVNQATPGDSGVAGINDSGAIHTDKPDATVADVGGPSIRKSTIIAGLAATGIEVDVPLHEAMDTAKRVDALSGNHDQVRAIMGAFTKALGAECKDCHAARDTPSASDGGTMGSSDGGPRPAQLDFAKETEMKNIATRMWDRWAVGLQFKDTKAQLFCDSCHQGKKEFLIRGEDLGTWMLNNFVGKLETRSAEALKCGSCHGTPFDGEFLDTWK